MSTLTIIAVVTITPGNPEGVVASITWPAGDTQRATLAHDWGNDVWDWRNGRMPQSLTRLFRDWGLALHGERLAYTSPKDVGTDSNEMGRVMVYEVDYEG